jgi:hypothetical protein
MPLPSSLLLAVSLALAGGGAAFPAAPADGAARDMLSAELALLTPTQIDARILGTASSAAAPAAGGSGSCAGQSCVVADLSGSTGALPRYRPTGGDETSYNCIAKYNPRGVEAAAKGPPVPNQHLGTSSALLGAVNKLTDKAAARKPARVGRFAGRCAPNIVIFAKGTLEPGILGITVGPALQRALRPPQWSVNGVNYPADIPGDYCLGLPGGMVARDMLEGAAAKCPNSKLFVSGYSQGAMVAHNALGYASPQVVARVAVSPFSPCSFLGRSTRLRRMTRLS